MAYNPVHATVVEDGSAWSNAALVVISADGSGWACSKCTLSNSSALDRCDACGAARARSAAAEIPTAPLAPAAEKPVIAAEMKQRLSENMPRGLVNVVAKAAQDCAIRYWIVDNSGSMSIGDGKRFVTDPRSSVKGMRKQVSCSRWEELSETLRWVAKTATLLRARTEFRFLNPPTGAPQVIVVGAGDGENDVAAQGALERALASGPAGGTPLCASLAGVVTEVRASASALRSSGRTAVVVVASDGEASDGDLGRALAPLVGQPASVVVRLCTDDERVVEYWNDIDGDLELELDVLDDLSGEGAEVHAHNSWVAYGEALHRAREWGGSPKELDWLDERPLSPPEAQRLVEFILGPFNSSLQLDPDAFLGELDDALGTVVEVFDADTGQCRPWIDQRGLVRCVLKRGLSIQDICSRGPGPGCAVS